MSTTVRQLPSNNVLDHVVDVHCHPTDSPVASSSMNSLPIKICAMATRENDQSLVRDLAFKWPDKVVPCFGYHPWFTHWIALESPVSKEQHYRDLLLSHSKEGDFEEVFQTMLPELPEPILLADILSDLRKNMSEFSSAMLGEVGLDRAFRIPIMLNTSAPRRLSEFTVPLEHQISILEAQLDVAVEFSRNVSFHSVKSQQATLQLVDRMHKKHGEAWDMISIDMHSCGLSPEMWTSLERRHPNIYLSLSTTINARSRSHRALISACDSGRILAESDYHDVRGSTERTWEMITIIAEVKGWKVEIDWDPNLPKEEWGVVRTLEENWKTFSKGNYIKARRDLIEKSRSRRDRKDIHWNAGEESE